MKTIYHADLVFRRCHIPRESGIHLILLDKSHVTLTLGHRDGVLHCHWLDLELTRRFVHTHTLWAFV